MTACPCAQGLVEDGARVRLAEQGFDSEDIDRIVDAVPIATHNQRGIGTLYTGVPEDSDVDIDARQLLRIVESLDVQRDLRAHEALGRALRGREGPRQPPLRRGLLSASDPSGDRDLPPASATAPSSTPARRTSRPSTATTWSPSATACSPRSPAGGLRAARTPVTTRPRGSGWRRGRARCGPQPRCWPEARVAAASEASCQASGVGAIGCIRRAKRQRSCRSKLEP